MAVPQAFLNVLQSIQILQLPSQALPGDVVQAVLSADLNTVFDPLQQAQKVAQMTLSVLLDNIQLAAEEGKNDLEIVLKAVEFATPVDGLPASALDTAETAKDHLPYTIPTGVVGNNIVPAMGTYVEGLLGKIADNVTIVGSIAGSISGDVSTPAVLDNKFIPPTVSWRIQDSRGNTLTDGQQFVSQPGTLATQTPIFAFLPQFVEFTSSAVNLVSKVSVFVDLSFADVGGQPFNFTIGPVFVDVVQVQIPTIVVMTQNPLGGSFPGLTMVAVPASSAIHALTAISTPLRAVQTVMSNVAALASPASGIALGAADAALVGIFAGASSMITSLLAALSSVIDPNAFIIADQIMNYSSVEVSSSGCGAFGWFACHMNDRTSAILLVGPPGRSISCFNRYNLWVGTGAFSVTIGTEAAALLSNLTVSPPAGAAAGAVIAATPVAAPPAGISLSSVFIITPASGGTSFDNVISSMQFNP